MSVSAAHTLYALDLDPVTEANALFIDQITDQRINSGLQELLLAADGGVDPTYVATMRADPRLAFTTSLLSTTLGLVSNTSLIGGVPITADLTHDGAECFFQKMSNRGTRASGANHLKMTVKEGLMVFRGLQAAQDGVATMAIEVVPTYDGTNNPLVFTTDQSLIGSPSISEQFTVGPASINGSALSAIQSINLDTGKQLTLLSGDGEAYATYVAIQVRQPRLTLTTLDATAYDTFGLTGTVQAATDSVVYLRKMARGGTRETDATAEHISLTIDDGQWRVVNTTAAQGGEAIATVECLLAYDGTNDIIVVDPSVAIT